MAGTYNADTMTNGEVPAIHAGVNVLFANWALSETLSGATTVNLAVLPAGARVVDALYWSKYGAAGTGGEQINIAVQGNTLIKSAAESTFVRANWGGFGSRLTSDATVTLQYCNVVGTGTGSNVIRVGIQYLADKDGD